MHSRQGRGLSGTLSRFSDISSFKKIVLSGGATRYEKINRPRDKDDSRSRPLIHRIYYAFTRVSFG